MLKIKRALEMLTKPFASGKKAFPVQETGNVAARSIVDESLDMETDLGRGARETDPPRGRLREYWVTRAGPWRRGRNRGTKDPERT